MTDQPARDHALAPTTSESSLPRPSAYADETDTVFATVVLDQTTTDARTTTGAPPPGVSRPGRPTRISCGAPPSARCRGPSRFKLG